MYIYIYIYMNISLSILSIKLLLEEVADWKSGRVEECDSERLQI